MLGGINPTHPQQEPPKSKARRIENRANGNATKTLSLAKISPERHWPHDGYASR